MMRLRYYLHIDVDATAVPGDVIHAIHTESEPQEMDWSQQVRRYIGGALADAENALGAALPDGFAVRIDDAPVREQVQL